MNRALLVITLLKTVGFKLPYITKDFTAQVLAEGITAGHQSLRGRQHAYAQSTQYQRYVATPAVHSQAGLADALQACQHRSLSNVVLEPDAEHPVAHIHRHVIVFDIALFFQNAGQVHFDLRGRDQYALVSRHAAVSYAS